MSFFQTLGGIARPEATARSVRHLRSAWSRALGAAKRWLLPRPASVILEPYRRTANLTTYLKGALATLALGLFCLVYGFFFGLSAPYFLVAFLAPIALIALLVIWALPDLRTAPTYGLELLFPTVLVTLLLWPDYVAVALPGLPWITLLRLVNFPLTGLLLVCLSVSTAFRAELAQTCRSTRPLWICVGGFAAIQFVTLGISHNIVGSAQAVVLTHVAYTTVLVVAALTLRNLRYVERFLGLLCVIAVPLCGIGIYEGAREHVLWAGHIPSFLRIEDPSVQRMLSPSIRMYIDKYRVKATFRSPLAFAEYLSLLTPFLLHFAFTQRNWLIRISAGAMVPLIFYVIRLTDARLGVVGMLVSVLLYGLLYSLIRWRKHPHDLFASAVVYAYPLMFCTAVGLIFASHRLHSMVLGDGAQAGSSQARDAQLAMALPKVWANPLGYGAGECGRAMGFGANDFVTIDNYFIALILDHGVLGVLFWYGMFILAIFWSVKYSLSSKYAHRADAQWLAPSGVCLTAFLIVKWVHGQSDNHAVFFSLLGMVVAIVHRLKTSDEGPSTTLVPIAKR